MLFSCLIVLYIEAARLHPLKHVKLT